MKALELGLDSHVGPGYGWQSLQCLLLNATSKCNKPQVAESSDMLQDAPMLQVSFNWTVPIRVQAATLWRPGLPTIQCFQCLFIMSRSTCIMIKMMQQACRTTRGAYLLQCARPHSGFQSYQSCPGKAAAAHPCQVASHQSQDCSTRDPSCRSKKAHSSP